MTDTQYKLTKTEQDAEYLIGQGSLDDCWHAMKKAVNNNETTIAKLQQQGYAIRPVR